jgi:hypothetical protein
MSPVQGISSRADSGAIPHWVWEGEKLWPSRRLRSSYIVRPCTLSVDSLLAVAPALSSSSRTWSWCTHWEGRDRVGQWLLGAHPHDREGRPWMTLTVCTGIKEGNVTYVRKLCYAHEGPANSRSIVPVQQEFCSDFLCGESPGSCPDSPGRLRPDYFSFYSIQAVSAFWGYSHYQADAAAGCNSSSIVCLVHTPGTRANSGI